MKSHKNIIAKSDMGIPVQNPNGKIKEEKIGASRQDCLDIHFSKAYSSRCNALKNKGPQGSVRIKALIPYLHL